MREYGIGQMLSELQRKSGISQAQLTEGISTKKEFFKIETGERIPNPFLLDYLLSRMGSSANKLEYTVSEKDYHYYILRVQIEEKIEMGDYEAVCHVLQIYRKDLSEKETIHQQYADMATALVLWNNEERQIECIDWLEKAMDWTMPHWREESRWKQAMSWREAGLLVLWAEKKKQGKEKIEFLQEMIKYIEKQWKDPEEKEKIYPYTVRILSQELLGQGKYAAVEKLCSKGIDLLVEVGAIVNMSELLALKIEAMEKLSQKEQEITRLKKQMNALQAVCEAYYARGRRVGLFPRLKRELYLEWEIIRKQRQVLNITQEELSADICSQETLARIEKGNRKPHNRNYDKLTERLFWNKEKRSNVVNTWDYCVLEKRQKIASLVNEQKYEEAKAELKDFQFQKTVESRQYLLYIETAIQLKQGEIEGDKAIEQFEHALKMTIQEKALTRLQEAILTRQEVNILNNMAIAYLTKGEREKAISIYQSILESYANSKIIPVYRANTTLLVLCNLAGCLESADRFEEALEVSEEAIQLELKCGKVNGIAGLLINTAYTMERSNMNKLMTEKMYQQAYYIAELMKNRTAQNIARKCYKEAYEKELD